MSTSTLDRAGRHEVRTFDIVDYEFRADTTGDGFTFEGVASVVDQPYEVRDELGVFMETIRAGAFNKTLRDSKADVGLFINHGHKWGQMPIATRNATGEMSRLEMRADPNLRVKAALNPARSEVQNLRIAVDDGLMRQMSIGFGVPAGKQTWTADYSDRQIHEVKLMETSIVWQGSNPLTSGQMRSLTEMVDALTTGEVDEADIHRMISHLAGLLPQEPAPEVNPFALSDDEKVAWLKAALDAA